MSVKMLRRLLDDSNLAKTLASMTSYAESVLNPGCHCIIMVNRPELGGLVCESLATLPFYAREVQSPVSIRPDSTPSGRAAFFKAPIFCPDLLQEPLWGPYFRKSITHHVRSAWAFPILNSEREVLGTFTFYFPQPLECKPAKDESLFRTFVQLAGITLDRYHNREQTEQILKEMQSYQERLNLAISSRRMGVWDLNVHEDRLIWDENMFEMFGLSKSEASGTLSDWMQFLPPEDAAAISDSIERIIRQQSEFDFQYRILKKGETRYMKCVGQVTRDSTGEILRMTGLNWDITEKVHINKRLEQERAKVIANSKMASLGEMASGLAHEINNPLTIILNRASQLKAKIERAEFDPASALSELEKIEKTVERIAKIIRGLRAFSRNADSDPMVSCDLESIVNDTLELCYERVRKEGIRLRLKGDFSRHRLHARPSQINQVLLNLLNNSIDAIQTMSQPWIEISITLQEDMLALSVTDSGHGIPAHIAERMMEPFFTTKEVGRGTGLGLAISRGIIEDHRGRFFYDAESPNTRFTILLPTEKKAESMPSKTQKETSMVFREPSVEL
jgi:C4-dicarboxylate-specific signal transduction histidine kinase